MTSESETIKEHLGDHTSAVAIVAKKLLSLKMIQNPGAVGLCAVLSLKNQKQSKKMNIFYFFIHIL